MSNRTPLMAGNWKMNLDHLEANHLVQGLAMELKDHDHDYTKCEVLVIPPFTDIRTVQTVVEADSLSVKYGAQDVSTHDNGAYTGEISTEMLTKLGVSYVVMGHSERREYHGESDALVGAKARKVLDAGMTPILCCGEALEIRRGSARSGVEAGHGGEGVRLEGGSPDQRAVDVGLGHELLDVGGLGGTAVEDTGGVGRGVAVVGTQGLTDRPAHLLGVLGGGGLAGADGPDGLVGDDDLGDVLTAPSLQGGADLP